MFTLPHGQLAMTARGFVARKTSFDITPATCLSKLSPDVAFVRIDILTANFTECNWNVG